MPVVPRRGRPRLSPARFRYRRITEMVRGENLSQSDKDYIRAAWTLQPDLRRTYFLVRHDGRIDRRVRQWFTETQMKEWKKFVEDKQDRELNR